MKSQTNFYRPKGNRVITPNEDYSQNKNQKSSSQTKMPYLKTSYNNSSQKNFYKSSGQFLLRNPAISPRHTPKYDIEGIRNEFLIPRNRRVIKPNEINELKIAYTKLKEDNMNNKNIIEAILGVECDEEINQRELKEKIENKQLNDTEAMLLKQTGRNILLTNQIDELKKRNNAKDAEIERLKHDSKVIEMLELDANYTQAQNELRKLTTAYENAYCKLYFYENKINDLTIKCDYYKKMLAQAQGKAKALEEDNDNKDAEMERLKGEKETLEDKLKKKDYMIKKMQKEMKEKDQQIKSYNDSQAEMNAYTAEKEESNKKESATKSKLQNLKKENEKYKRKIAQLEQENNDYIKAIDEYEKEKVKLIAKAKNPPTTYREKEKQIKGLEEQLAQEKAKNEKKNKENENKINELQKENENCKNDIEELNKEKDDLNQQIEELNQQLKDLNEEVERKDEDLKNKDKVIQ